MGCITVRTEYQLLGEEYKGKYGLVITHLDNYKKILVIKTIRELTGFSLCQAKDATEDLPFYIHIPLEEKEVNNWISKFKDLDTGVEIQKYPIPEK